MVDTPQKALNVNPWFLAHLSVEGLGGLGFREIGISPKMLNSLKGKIRGPSSLKGTWALVPFFRLTCPVS